MFSKYLITYKLNLNYLNSEVKCMQFYPLSISYTSFPLLSDHTISSTAFSELGGSVCLILELQLRSNIVFGHTFTNKQQIICIFSTSFFSKFYFIDCLINIFPDFLLGSVTALIL